MTDLIAIPRPIIKQVLETFEEVAQWESDGGSSHPASKAIELLRAALDQSNRQSAHESELMMNDVSYRRKFE